MKNLYDGKFVESLPPEGTANTGYCDCWWYLPLSLGLIALAYGLGWLSAVWLIQS